MTVLVTGGTGLVGAALSKLIEKEHPYLYREFVFLGNSSKSDLRDANVVARIFEEYNPDVVIHLASRVGGVFDNAAHNLDYLISNTRMNMNVIEACEKYSPQVLIQVLSTCIFSEKCNLPLRSEDMHKDLPHASNIGYAYSKRLLSIASRHLSKTQVISLIPTNIYGENDNFNVDSGHVIPALIHKIYKAKVANEKEFIVHGNPQAMRQFVYAKDFARIILEFVLRPKKSNLNLIISPSQESQVSLYTLVHMISQRIGFKGTIEFDNKIQGQLIKTSDDKECKDYLPENFKFAELSHGLNMVINHFLQKYSCVRN